MVFLVPIFVHTAGDVTNTIAILTTGLTQGGSASPALFRIFIDDLPGELRKTIGLEETAEGNSLKDAAKLVADDVIHGLVTLLAKNESDLQVLLDTCTDWAARNGLGWKPKKCSIVSTASTL